MTEMPRQRVALTLPAPTGSVADSIQLARECEALGWDDIWLADAGGLDALTLTAMLLQSSGHANALRTLIDAEQDRGPDFLCLANALSALYSQGCNEKRLLDATLLAMPR